MTDVNERIDQAFDFLKEVVDDPSILDDFPPEGVILFGDKGTGTLTPEDNALLLDRLKQGQNVIVVGYQIETDEQPPTLRYQLVEAKIPSEPR